MAFNWTVWPGEIRQEIADQVEEFGFMDSNDYLEALENNDPFVPDSLEDITEQAADELGGEARDVLERSTE